MHMSGNSAVGERSRALLNNSSYPQIQHGQPPSCWPTLKPEALDGLAGEIVRELDQYTEADPVAVLAHLLAQLSCYIGKSPAPEVLLGGVGSPLAFWPVVIGDTSKARKGTAAKEAEGAFERSFPGWSKDQLRGNLSSGEGLAYAVRDAGCEPGDEGIQDKRLYLVQPEFGSMLKLMGREGNSLSGIIRDAWDGVDLAPLTKNSRVRATKPHIVIVGHVTKEELRKELKAVEQCNGFGNRFVWLAVHRSKVLTFPPPRDERRLDELATRLKEVGGFAQNVRSVGWSSDGKDAWASVYPVLSEGKPGYVGALLGRAEAHVGRLAALYALLDQKSEIEACHVQSALAIWEHSEVSAEWIFGHADQIAEQENKLLRELVRSRQLTDSDVSKLFGHNLASDKLGRLKDSLVSQGLAHHETASTGGRPMQIWKSGPRVTG